MKIKAERIRRDIYNKEKGQEENRREGRRAKRGRRKVLQAQCIVVMRESKGKEETQGESCIC